MPKNQSTEIAHSPSGWVIDKRISLPTLITLVVYALCTAWYVSKMDSRVDDAAKNAAAADVKAQRALDSQVDAGQRMVRIETLLENTNQSINRIEKKLEK